MQYIIFASILSYCFLMGWLVWGSPASIHLSYSSGDSVCKCKGGGGGGLIVFSVLDTMNHSGWLQRTGQPGASVHCGYCNVAVGRSIPAVLHLYDHIEAWKKSSTFCNIWHFHTFKCILLRENCCISFYIFMKYVQRDLNEFVSIASLLITWSSDYPVYLHIYGGGGSKMPMSS